MLAWYIHYQCKLKLIYIPHTQGPKGPKKPNKIQISIQLLAWYIQYQCICAFDTYNFLISLNNPLFKNIPLVRSFWHFVICCICVFRIFVFFVIARLTHGNIIFDILGQTSFQKYTTCWVCLALRHMLYLCICLFVFARFTHVNIIFDNPEQSSFKKFTTCWGFLALRHMLYLCNCVFVFVYLWIRQ